MNLIIEISSIKMEREVQAKQFRLYFLLGLLAQRLGDALRVGDQVPAVLDEAPSAGSFTKNGRNEAIEIVGRDSTRNSLLRLTAKIAIGKALAKLVAATAVADNRELLEGMGHMAVS